MDVLGGAGPASGDIMGELAEPIGLTDYEVIRIAHEGARGLGMSFICMPGSAVIYRVIVYVIMYLMAGMALDRRQGVRCQGLELTSAVSRWYQDRTA